MPFAFSIYPCAGVIVWNLFAEMLGRLNNVFLESGNLIKRANFPRICLLIVVVLSALINFSILLGIYLLFLAIIGHWPGRSMALQLLFTMVSGVALGTLNVCFRDAGQIIWWCCSSGAGSLPIFIPRKPCPKASEC